MKKIVKKIINLTLACSIISLASCEAEKDFMKKSSISEKSKSKITFSEFKRETGLNEFKTTIKVNQKNSAFNRNADGSYELSDFDIDTEFIKRLELENKITYSFRIYPKVIISTTSFYNLTIENKNGEWIQNVIELKPTFENLDKLLSGTSNDIDGKISLLFTSNENSIIPTDNCYTIEIIGDNCKDNEISSSCTTEKYSTFCFENDIIIGEELDVFDVNNNNEIDHSFILNTNNLKENLKIFADKHVLLNNQIMNLMETENNIAFNDLSFTEFTSYESVDDFKQALANAGVIKYSELGDLLFSQSLNIIEFQEKNKDFMILNEETKQTLISNAVDEAIANNPIDWKTDPGYPQQTERISCYQQYQIDRARCNRNNNVAAIGVAASFFGGPVAVFGACLTAMWMSKNCFADALEDYQNCP